MSQTLEELQAILVERIAKLDEERKTNALQQAKEREALLLEMDLERKQRLDEYQAKVSALEAKKKAEEEAREAQRIKDTTARVAKEQKQNALEETLKQQREKLEWLTTAISNAEFMEEQHRKQAESLRTFPSIEVAETGEINVEHPVSPSNVGEAVAGTSGETPDTASMSDHLKQILRQATRQY